MARRRDPYYYTNESLDEFPVRVDVVRCAQCGGWVHISTGSCYTCRLMTMREDPYGTA